MIARRAAAVVAGAALWAGPVLAHDLWISPSTFRPVPGEVVRVQLLVGDQPASAEPVIRDPARLLRLSAFEAAGAETPVPGFDGQYPAGLWKPTAAGPAILIYESSPRPIELPAERFDHYLAEEGLEPIAAERARRGESATAGRELYSRSVKALVQVGEGPLRDRVVGLPLEFVLDEVPAGKASARLLWRGRPAPGALVEAVALDGEPTRLATRSDREGRVSFALPRGGRWLLATVHMERLEPGQNAEWRSTWTSLAFELPTPHQ
jgi:uncharacterized GH25 family protein